MCGEPAHKISVRIEQAVREPRLALVEEGFRDIDIFADHRADGHVAARDQFIGARAQDRLHRAVEPVHRPAAREPRDDRRVDFVRARKHALHDIVEKGNVGIGIFGVLDDRADAVLVELVDELRDRRRFHLVLVERLHGGEAGGGAGLGALVHGFSTLIDSGR